MGYAKDDLYITNIPIKFDSIKMEEVPTKHLIKILKDVPQVARLFKEGNPIELIAEHMDYDKAVIEEMIRCGLARI